MSTERPQGRTQRRAFGWLAIALTTALLSLTSKAGAGEKSRDLGPIPLDGAAAAATLGERQKRVIRELACGSESGFIDKIRNPPDGRPLANILAKAAVLAGRLGSDASKCEITQVFASADWDATNDRFIAKSKKQTERIMGVPVTVENPFGQLKDDINVLNDELKKTPGVAPDPARTTEIADEIKRLLNEIELDTFGSPCNSAVSGVTVVVRDSLVEYRVTYSLSLACLEQQINAVILAPDFVRIGNPGTDKLPCHLLGKAKGDWDMAVASLTRITFLLRQAGRLRAMSSDSARAMDKLQLRLLTLSGPPAQDVIPIWHCGNPDNQYGSARDRLDDEDFYDPDLAKTVEGDAEGSDFWEDFWDVLAFALLLLAAGLALGAIAELLLMLFGPSLAAAVILVLLLIAEVPQTIIGALFGGVEETENHLLMQNSAKYLRNKLAIEESLALGDEDAVEAYEEFNEDIHAWFMERLHRITENDFAEYNAKPYIRHSFTALLNVHDFSCSPGLPTCTSDDSYLVEGVAAVGDLTSTKMALGSNQGRRIVPFRRLSHENTNFTIGKVKDDDTREPVAGLFDLLRGADHMVGAMQLWTGQTFHGPDGHASEPALGHMIWEATSDYAPHRMILDLALDRSSSWKQTFHHAGWERYSRGPGWLLTAGGTETGYAQGFRWPLGTVHPRPFFDPILFIKDSDRGAGVPTTLILSSGKRLPDCEWMNTCESLPPARLEQPRRQHMYSDFVRFEGKVTRGTRYENDEPMSFNDNFCVEGSFACGINMQVPDFLDDKNCSTTNDDLSTPSPRVFSIIDSSTCAALNDGDPTTDFYVVVYKQPCKGGGDCGNGADWGFVEVVSKATAPTAEALRGQILGANGGNFDKMGSQFGKGTFTYASLANGVITFDPHGSYVTAVNGVAQSHGSEPDWPRASGDIVNRTGEGRYTITNPRLSEMITIDFSNEKEPKRDLP